MKRVLLFISVVIANLSVFWTEMDTEFDSSYSFKESHGCWCGQNAIRSGEPVDILDSACKKFYECLRCVKIVKNCEETEIFSPDKTVCNNDADLCALDFISKLQNISFQNEFSNQNCDHDNANFRTKFENSNDVDLSCCGNSVLNYFPYRKNNDRNKCCGPDEGGKFKTYDSAFYDCCDGQVKQIGACSVDDEVRLAFDVDIPSNFRFRSGESFLNPDENFIENFEEECTDGFEYSKQELRCLDINECELYTRLTWGLEKLRFQSKEMSLPVLKSHFRLRNVISG